MSTATDERINISAPLTDLANRLAVPYKDIAEINIRSDTVLVTLYRRSEDGQIYLDTVVGEAATYALGFKVTT